MQFTYIGDQSNKEIRTAGSYANSAYLTGNSAFVQANSAYNSQNTTGSYANSAYNQANTATNNAAGASLYANGAFTSANTADGKAVTAGSYANSAYSQANTATSNATGASLYANGAFIQANAAYNSQNTTGNYANSAFITANNALPKTGGTITGSLTVTQDVSVTGNLIVLGNTTSINTSSITVQDTLLVLGLGNYTSDVLDIGFASHYNDGSNAHTGLIRDASEKQWLFFEGYTPEVSPNNNIIITDASFKYSNVRARDFTGNLIANTVTVNGYDLFTYTTNAYTQANTADSKAVTSGSYANSAYTQANTATTNADAADSKAVTSGSYANSAYTQANTATNNAAGASLYANAAFIQANAAYNAANTGAADSLARQIANAAFIQANAAYAQANTGGGGGSTRGAVTFYVDRFTANGATTTFSLNTAPTSTNYTSVSVDGIIQHKNTYTLSGNIITFDSTFESGANIEVTSTTTDGASFLNRTFIGNGTSNTFTISANTSANSVIVTDNGIIQTPVVDYTISGTTLTFTTTPAIGSTIQVRELSPVVISTGVLEITDTYARETANAANAAVSSGVSTGKSIAMAIIFGF